MTAPDRRGVDHARSAHGMVPNPDITHQPIPVHVGPIGCLDRHCEQYLAADGHDAPAAGTCTHIREVVTCSCQRTPSGEYTLSPCTRTGAWPTPA